MSQIDWSKAPQSATHFVMSNENGIPGGWYRADGVKMRDIANEGEYTFRLDDLHSQRMIHLIARPEQWNGEGLPPVGAVCEYRVGSGTWYPCAIRYITTPISDEEVQVVVHCPHLSGDQIGGVGTGIGEINFRPIRTPEQIAAEEREAKAKAMWQAIYFNTDPDYWERAPEGTRDTFRAAIDAGWQQVKQ